jgi:hypothetical protein
MAEIKEEVTRAWVAAIIAVTRSARVRGWPRKVSSCWLLLMGKLVRWLERSTFSRVSLLLCARPRTRRLTPINNGKRLRDSVKAWTRSLLFCASGCLSCA